MAEKVKALSDHAYAEIEREFSEFEKATKRGVDEAKTRKLAAEIRHRLQATPEPTPFGSSPTPTPTPSATPSPSATPASTNS